MKLSVLDRIVIIAGLLQSKGNMVELEKSAKIDSKLKLTEEEIKMFDIVKNDSDEVDISIKDTNALVIDVDYDLDCEDIKYLKDRVDILDGDSKITMFMFSTMQNIRNYK